MAILRELFALKERFLSGFRAVASLEENLGHGKAVGHFQHIRNGKVIWEETHENQITNAGRDFLHQQGYQTSGLGSNGLNWIALTNTAVTPAAGDTTLSGEITTNGLARAQGTVNHTAGTNTTTVAHTFTCATSSQSCQAVMLFTASSAGTGNHELVFTARTLQVGDQISVTYTITLG
jgi:hypothetical protein